MSELAKTLELFGFLSIDDVTLDSLKKSFKTRILEVHPDKGGDADLFDKMLHSYVYLTETVQRISGGRATLQNILSPDELKRSDEIINQFFEEFQNDEFNRQFEKQKKETHGYASWLKCSDTNLLNGAYGNATQKAPTFNEKDLHKVFEESITYTSSDIILHPEEMAIGSNFGTALIENENCYTSDIFSNPEYTDLYSAFTTHNIISDKINIKGHYTTNCDTIHLDAIIAERNKEITPLNDEELKAIHNFEKKKLNDDIKGYFNCSSNTLENWQPNIQIEEYNNFVINL